MTALAWMRLAAFVRSGRVLAPLLAALVALGVLYGGGAAQAGEAYGVSALVLFPVLAWQTKLLLDAEPDVQRRIVLAVTSPAREVVAGLLAGAAAAVVVVTVAMVAPWLIGGVTGPAEPGDAALGVQVAAGAWAHLLAVPPAVLVGALASRAVTRSSAYGVTALLTGVVCTMVFGLKGSVAPWLVPPVMATARALAGEAGPDAASLLGLAGHAVAWTGLAALAYAGLRRVRT